MERMLRWFLPAALRHDDSEAARRALMVVAGCLCTAALAAAVAGMQLAVGVAQSAVAAAICAAFAAVLLLSIRVTGAVRAIAVLVCAAVWLAALAVAFATDGALAASLFYLALAPALATLVIGVRGGLVWAVATFVALSLLLAIHGAGRWPSVAIEPEIVRGSAIRGAIVFDFALILLTGAYEWLRGGSTRRAEASEQRYRALAANGSDLIAEFDEDGRYVFASPNHDALGMPVDSLSGRRALSAVHPDDQGLMRAAVEAVARDGTARSQPIRAMGQGGRWRWFEVSLTAYRTLDRARRVIAVTRDVTERLELEERLRQSQKMEAVGQLASGAAHDFNNLLMVISGSAEQLAEQHAEGSEERAAAEEILHAAERGADVTRRLLALSRPTGDRRALLDLNAVVANVEQLLRRLLRSDVALDLVLGEGLPAIAAPAGQIEQVLVNLALNAADAMPHGGRMRIATSEADGGVRIEVADDGCGMDATTRERAFEPFFTTKPPGAGTGLGLYMVYSIVHDLDGSIAVDSAPGHGTRVTISLPGKAAVAAVAAASSAAPPSRGDETILVVEDGLEVREVIRRALTRSGYRVVVAQDGACALAVLAEDPSIDLVVSDVVMPNLGGFELLAALRERRPGLPVLLVSGHPGDVRDPLPEGVELLAKPFALADLRGRVRALLDAR